LPEAIADAGVASAIATSAIRTALGVRVCAERSLGGRCTGIAAEHTLSWPARRASYGAWGSLTEPRLAAGAEGGGTTGPMSPSGASSRSTITGA